MNRIFLLLKYMYQWNKITVWKTSSALMMFYILYIYFAKSGVTVLFTFAALYFSFSFWAKTSLYQVGARDGFSFKYILSLPLTRKEIIFATGIINFIRTLPFALILSFMYYPSAYGHLSAKFFVGIILALTIGGYLGLLTRIDSPRTSYFQNKFSHVTKSFLLTTFLITFTLIAFVSLVTYRLDLVIEFLKLTKFLLSPVEIVEDAVVYIFKSWFLPPILMIVTYMIYLHILDRWTNEKSSYPKKIPKQIKNSHFIDFGCVGALITMSLYASTLAPLEYNGSAFLAAVYENDQKTITNLIAEGEDINKVNKFGYSPLMTAAQEGNLEMFKFLEERNATTKGKTVKDGSNLLDIAIQSENEDLIKHIVDNGFNLKAKENYPLHALAQRCMTKSLDYLIEKGADIHLKDKENKTALHHAANYGCYGVATSLLEKGIDPLQKDKSGKIASDFTDSNKDFIYFIEKQSRKPANKKN